MITKISTKDLKEMMDSGKKFKLVDVLPGEHYEKEHIKGAISIPLDEIEEKADTLLDRDELIVTYCAGFKCSASTGAAEKLVSMGYKNVRDYKGGLQDYKANNLPVEGCVHHEQD
jgi:rhodanese-related sulfurtransferase